MEAQVGQKQSREVVADVQPRDDEISLVDLWLVLLRHKWVVIGLALLGLVAGVLLATLRQPVYAYVTTVEIGGWLYPPKPVEIGVLRNKENYDLQLKPVPERVFTPLDSKESIRYFLLGTATNGFSLDDSDKGRPDSGRILTLVSEGTSAQAEPIAAEHEAAVTRLTRFHGRLLEDLRYDFESRLKRSEQRLSRVEREVELIDKLLAALEKSTSRLVATGDSTEAGSPLFGLSERLFQAQERLRTSQDDREVLISHIRDLRTALDSMASTRQVGAMVRSGPKGPTVGIIIALAAILGLFAGLFGAFFAEFLARVREARAT